MKLLVYASANCSFVGQKVDVAASPNVLKCRSRLEKVRLKYDLRKYCFTNVLLIYGTVCQIGLLQMRVLIHLKQDLIHSGITRILCVISVHN